MSGALHPEVFGDWCEYGVGVKVRAYDLERFRPTQDERKDLPKGYTFFRFKVTVENVGSEALTVDIRRADVRVGRDGLTALPVFSATDRIEDVNLYPLRRATGVYAFCCRPAHARLIDAQIDIRADGDRLENADWTGQLGAARKTPATKGQGDFLASGVVEGVHEWLLERAREGGRHIAEEDPHAAREKGIGDPYVARTSRGVRWGLADVNALTAGELAAAVGIGEEAAQRVVSARELLGGSFDDVDQVFRFTSLSDEERAAVEERAVALPPEL
ncbi:hypothetical protein [Streptomyces sp. SP18CS02]|uniref:hypothetical protein n=1 Tax=Streptomyces sp. SP18CS02 TaxID=3002531 RepID=UPI002E79D345|nr:hypothetical protein [Streptomyces sp. SP18CS02]MEE1752974.1 hypothetical protein [Streptomyces sp. SP18CS02]